jgi:DNA-binding transcriptional regulator GbsR (MarR family)
MTLPPVIQKVVLHWGEMGARWGVNRSVAQIHALLWLTGRAMTAEEISETLGIARSNASTSLDELQTYRLVALSHVIGDRRNYYEARGDTWDVVQTIVDERKKREIDPTLEVLRAARHMAETDPSTPPDVRRRLTEMLSFIERMTDWYEQMKRVPRTTLQRLIKMGTSITRLIAR